MILRAEPDERALLLKAVEGAHEYQQKRDDRLARKIVSELGEAIKRGGKGRRR